VPVMAAGVHDIDLAAQWTSSLSVEGCDPNIMLPRA
jgi:hypothetical protein